MNSFDGKMKAITFSYDDGVTQDQRLIALFNKYGMKATFNVNSGRLGTGGYLIREDVTVAHVKPRPCEVRKIYAGHEVAVHTLTHPGMTLLSDEDVVREVEEDRIALSKLVGYEVISMAYPGAQGPLYDERVKTLIRTRTGVRFARTTTSNYDFAPQQDLYEFKPTVYHHMEWDKMFGLGEAFLNLKPDFPAVYYIWGHAYEFDIADTWDKFEDFLRMMAGREDIAYLTNRQAILGVK